MSASKAPKVGVSRPPVGTFMNIDNNENINVHNDVNINNDVNVHVYGKKKKFEDLYTRQTVYIRNDFAEKIATLAGNERGVKTKIINDALELFFKKNKI